MIFEVQEFTLKDGKKALLKNPGQDDVQGMLDYLAASSAEIKKSICCVLQQTLL